jgi:hypothetical protein
MRRTNQSNRTRVRVRRTVTPRDRDRSSDRCKLSFGDVSGTRAPASAIDCLRSSLRAEKQHVEALAQSRREILSCIQQARSAGATYSSIAAAIVPATGFIRETIAKRRRVAGAIACRVHLAKKKSRLA